MSRGRSAAPSRNTIEDRNALVLANRSFIHSHIRQKWADLVDTEHYADAVGEATVGMFRAAELYDETSGNTFITYAVHWMDYHIRRYVDAIMSPVYVPASRIALRKHLRKAHQKLWGNPRSKLADLLSTEKSVPPGTVWSVLSARVAQTNVFYDQACSEPGPEDVYCHQHATKLVEHVLGFLDTRTQRMVRMRHGDGGEEKTLEEVAAPWSLTRERARQILNAAQRKLLRAVPSKTRREILNLFSTTEGNRHEELWMPVESFQDQPDRYFEAPRYESRFDCPCCGHRVSSSRTWQFECAECGYDTSAISTCRHCSDPVLHGFPCYCDYAVPRQEGTLKWHMHRILLLASGCTLDRLITELEEAGFRRSSRELEVRLQRDEAVLKSMDGSYFLVENAPESVVELNRVELRLARIEAEFERKSAFVSGQIRVVRKDAEKVAVLRRELLELEAGYLAEKDRLLARWECVSGTNAATKTKE